MNLIYKLRCIVILLIIFSFLRSNAWNMRRISNSDGMTNSAALSLCQDYTGMLWIGTCDGINLYDGAHVYPYSHIYPQSPLSGNIIEGMIETSPGNMFIQTNYGMNMLNIDSGEIKVFDRFRGNEILAKNSLNELFVLDEEGQFYYYNEKEARFIGIEGVNMERDSVLTIAFVADQMLIFGRDGMMSSKIHRQGNTYAASQPVVVDGTHLRFAKVVNDTIYTIGADGMMRRFVPSIFENQVVTSLADLIDERGQVSSITVDRDENIYISFKIRGVVRLEKSANYDPVDLGINVGVFSLLAYGAQNVVWIGSDCSGVYTCFPGRYDVTTRTYKHLGYIIANPVRCIYLDDDRNLWLGTKGDGLLKVSNFDSRDLSYDGLQLLTSGNSPLHHNSVFALAGSSKSRIWIGTEEGINVYDTHSRMLSKVRVGHNMRWIHGIYEQNDTILWAASIGQGVFRGIIDDSGAVPIIRDVKQYLVGDETFSSNYFFSMSVDDKGNPVFSNRGKGAFVYDTINDRLKPLSLRGNYGTSIVHDVFSAIKEDTTLWLGTGTGLVMQTPRMEKLYNGTDMRFFNSTVHCLLKDPSGDIWISTNQGLVNFDPESEHARTYDSNFGVGVTEFSDGASFITPDSLLLFGGVDGIVSIRRNPLYSLTEALVPAVKLIGLSVDGKNQGLQQYLDSENNRLTLGHDQSNITLIFAAPDYINSCSTSYMYSLDGRDWIDNGNNNSLSFTNLDSRGHKLYIKYINHDSLAESKQLELELYITPRWYESTIAYIVYALLLTLAVTGIILYFFKRQQRAQNNALEKMRQAHKEKVYEEKLRFFTNITHEFCTPITLISGPCERILAYENSDDYIRRYATLIYNNSRRLNNLIQEIIDLRRIETGHNLRKVRRIDVSELCNETISTFDDMAERCNVAVVNEVSPDIVWNTDYSSISKIMTNLISNAFKYTHTGGTIRISLDIVDDKLRLEVWNTGEGIREEDKARIFNRYAILDNIEEKVVRGLSARNGLGMAICHSVVEQLEGTIEIESTPGSYASFIVTLPPLEVDATAPQDVAIGLGTSGDVAPDPVRQPAAMLAPDGVAGQASRSAASTHRLLIVDDNEEMLALLADSLSEYDVTTATDGASAIDLLTKQVFDLVITDVMMPGSDGLELTRQIKANKHTSYIPLIILSAKVSNDEIIEGIDSGADVYIRKPFSFGYLRAMISRLIERQRQLRDYYTTSGSAFQYENGQLVSREDKEFIDNLTTYIDANIDDSELSIEALAQHLNVSVRNLYRKLKDLGMDSPNDLIKNHRMTSAARLLCTTSLTVQEIMFRIGFTNRSHFYREFAKRYHMTPKEYRQSNQTRDDSLGNAVDIH